VIRERVRRLPGGNTVVKVTVFLLGLFFIALGLALSVLPGPFTIPPVLLGLVIWALEFAWAERLVERARGKAREAWAAARAHPWRAGLVSGGGVALLVVAVLLAARYELIDHATSLLSLR
jgi:Kef-type K+ transport system membrane component KefB